MKNKQEKSFTLIELLVVIATIGLLSSIVLVALKGGKEKANVAKTLQWARSIQAQLGGDVVGNWSFNSITDSTALDATGYNNGTIYGATTTDGVQGLTGKALYFDGTNDYVQLPNLGIFQSFTIEGWIRGDGDSLIGATGYNTLIGAAGGNRILYAMNGRMLAQMGAGSHYSSALIPRGQWGHAAYVYDYGATRAKWYINGNSDTELAGAISFNQPQKIGAYDLLNYMMNGAIDEVRIYSRALTAMEIQKRYAQGLPRHQFAERR